MDLNRLCGMAISRLHISSFQFYMLTPAEFYYSIQDQQEREKLSIELPVHAIWESARFIVHRVTAQNPYIKRSPSSEKAIRPFPWDTQEKKESKEQSLEQMKLAMRAMASAFKNKNKKGRHK